MVLASGGAADGRDQLLLGGLDALEEELHQLVVVLGHGLDQTVAPLTGDLGVVGGDVDDVVHLALGRAPRSRSGPASSPGR